ncbi:MAG TPA: LutB/LldF family L-lactate oxidation iron-sulfur protein [Azospirillaceae bacterium]|nr:LutB/LldF family L-lactate oxidation iron-sulfur protein [Azospirillaceae bacterium]
MQATSHAFEENARKALNDPGLQKALGRFKLGFTSRRAAAMARLPEFEALRDEAKAIKDHTLANLDLYLERYEAAVKATGGHVHWASTPAQARQIILDICRSVGAKTVTKGKSMVAEEIGLNDHLEENGVAPIETDLGEYIIQLRREGPSHIIAPAIHLNKEDVAEAFREKHTTRDPARPLDDPGVLVAEARAELREKYLMADVGITGANFLVAETGSSIIVTNEGNGDLTQILPKVHIVLASLEKLVPTLEDASTILRLLARSATGQEFSVYTTVSTGPRRAADPDGPEQYHVVLLDNGRSAMLGTEFQDMLRCIRCSACINHCPVYAAVGGHAYGWVYPGPMGSVLTPSLIGMDEAGHLPHASTFCGKCESVCPMKIPLPGMMRRLREQQFEARKAPAAVRYGLDAWAFFAKRPGLYHLAARAAMGALGAAGRRRGRFRSLPLAAGWTGVRDMPAPQGKTFQQLWAERQGRNGTGRGRP